MTRKGDNGVLSALVDSMQQAQSSRVRDYLGSGKDNYEADRILADRIRAIYPTVGTSVAASRAFHRAAIEHLAQDGIRQFIDIGAGLGPSVHLVAQSVASEARIVYVDNDPIVLCHGRAMSTGPGVHWSSGDLDKGADIVRFAGQVLNFDEPVAVSLVGVLELVPGQSHALRAVRALLAPLAAGSALVMCTTTADHAPEQIGEVTSLYTEHGILYRPRTRDQFAAFFEHLVLDEDGIDTPTIGAATEAVTSVYAAVGRKP